MDFFCDINRSNLPPFTYDGDLTTLSENIGDLDSQELSKSHARDKGKLAKKEVSKSVFLVLFGCFDMVEELGELLDREVFHLRKMNFWDLNFEVVKTGIVSKVEEFEELFDGDDF